MDDDSQSFNQERQKKGQVSEDRGSILGGPPNVAIDTRKPTSSPPSQMRKQRKF